MLTATFELEQEDVNPDDYLELKQQQLAAAATKVVASPTKHLLNPVVVAPAAAATATASQSPTSIRQSLGPLASVNGNSNSCHGEKENADHHQEPPEPEEDREEPPVAGQRSVLLRKLDEDIRSILQGCDKPQKQSRRKRHCLSLSAVVDKSLHGADKVSKQSPLSKSQPAIVRVSEEKKVEEAKSSQERNERLSQQQVDWDLVEVCTEEPEPEPEKSVAETLDFDSLFGKKKRFTKSTPRTYSGCSSSRLSLSKDYHRRRLLEEQRQLSLADSQRKRKQEVSDQSEDDQHEQQQAAKCAKLVVSSDSGEDDMSIHHQQQHHHHYHLPCTNSTTSNSSSFPAAAAASTSSLLLLQTAAATGGDSDSDGGGVVKKSMAGHSHYTRSKASRIQGQMSLESATDMAIAASLSDLPRSKVNSLQGRVDTGTATELAIAQSLNENQQNVLNSAVSAAATGSSSAVITQCLPETPASIAAAANMNNSLATLCNIGNSCYLNSVLYTLRFAPNFIHNLHHLIEDTDSVYQRLSQNKLKSSSLGRNIPGLHGASGRSWSSKDLASLGGSTGSNNSSTSTLMTSGTTNGTTTGVPPQTTLIREENLPPKSNRQVVTEQLHELFQNLHRNEAIESIEPYHAGNILRAVQDVSATFEGNQQQDAHEFLMCVLDSIRESCQALIKTITDHPDVLINTCPPVPESIETFVPETKSSGARVFFRRRKDPAKAAAKQQSPVTAINGGSGGATLPKVSGGGGGGDTTEQLVANFKNALFAKSSSALDEQLIRDRVQALGLDFFRDDFEGVTVAKTKCLACETCTEQKETMIDIAIPITASEVSDAAKNPQQFYQNSCITREYFRGDNKYRCEECCGYREAIRSISFEVLPRQLILQLKRFNGDMEKINSYIPTPFVLRCFCNTCLQKPDCDKPHIYRLYSVITHVGARMSVGHYIAYTSSLDVHGEYLGCGKDRRKQLLLSGGSIDAGGALGGGSFGAGTGASTGTQSGKSSEKSTSVQLKKLFGSKKASSAGDMSKKIKNNNKLNLINGMEGLNLINGAGSAMGNSNTASFGSQSGSNSPSSNGTPTGAGGSLASRIPCAGLNCCGIHLKNSHLSLYGHGHHSNNNGTSSSGSNSSATVALSSGDSPAAAAAADTNGVIADRSGGDGYTSSERNGMAGTTPAAFEQSLSQQLWHMCDDDKIKIMSQVEFQELLSPNRRHVITPYLLFYARYDLVPSAAKKEDGVTNQTAAGAGAAAVPTSASSTTTTTTAESTDVTAVD